MPFTLAVMLAGSGNDEMAGAHQRMHNPATGVFAV